MRCIICETAVPDKSWGMDEDGEGPYCDECTQQRADGIADREAEDQKNILYDRFGTTEF